MTGWGCSFSHWRSSHKVESGLNCNFASRRPGAATLESPKRWCLVKPGGRSQRLYGLTPGSGTTVVVFSLTSWSHKVFSRAPTLLLYLFLEIWFQKGILGVNLCYIFSMTSIGYCLSIIIWVALRWPRGVLDHMHLGRPVDTVSLSQDQPWNPRARITKWTQPPPLALFGK